MRRLILAIAFAPLALAACDKAAVRADDESIDASAGNTVASLSANGSSMEISVPGIGASLKLPKMDIGSHMDLDGMKLFPGTQIVNMDVRDDDKGTDTGGHVKLDFQAGALPGDVADYYRTQAAEAGYTVDPAGGASTIKARKGDGSQIEISLAPEGETTRGRILIGKE